MNNEYTVIYLPDDDAFGHELECIVADTDHEV
jgi:hypothetical protein